MKRFFCRQYILYVWILSLTAVQVARSEDCNRNGVDDGVDIANGTSWDCNANGVPDECDLTTGSIDFGTHRVFVSGPDLHGLVVADFDGDGDVDVAADRWNRDVNREVQGSNIEVLLNEGNGEFRDPVVYPPLPGARPSRYMAGADLDSDGDTDLVAVGNRSTMVRVLINHGDGTFTQTVNNHLALPSRGTLPVDLDGDGDVDVVSADWWSEPTSTISVLRNRGDGTFLDAERFPASERYEELRAAAGHLKSADFDGDGDPDLVLVNLTIDSQGQGVDSNVAVLLNDGEGRFPSVTTLPVEDFYNIAAADFDRDGISDLAIFVPEFLSVFRGQGDGTFAEPVQYPLTRGPGIVTTEDLDGDGDVDLILAGGTESGRWESGHVAAFLNVGDGTFAARWIHESVGEPHSLEFADMNLDGLPDIILSLSVPSASAPHGWKAEMSVLKNLGGSEFELASTFDQGRFSASILEAHDMDGDGDLDLLMGRPYIWSRSNPVNSVSFFVNATGQGSTPGCDSFVRGDVNSDGVLSVSDFIMLRRYLFGPGFRVTCHDAADVSDDEQIDMCDALVVLHALFLYPDWSFSIFAPSPEEGVDPTTEPTTNPPPFCFGPSPDPNDSLGCSDYSVDPAEETDDLVRIGDLIATPGAKVKLPIYVTTSVPVDAIQLVLEYDPGSLEIEQGALSHEDSFYAQFNRGSEPHPDRPEVSILMPHPAAGVLTVAIAGSFIEEGFEVTPGRNILVGWIKATVSENVPPDTTLTLTPTNGPEGEGIGPYRMRNEISYQGDARLVSILPQLEGAILQIVVDQTFFRGDSNSDSKVDLADAQYTLSYLFLGGEVPACQDAADANDDGQIDIADPVTILQYLFLGGSQLPPPHGEPGIDLTEDALHCARGA